MKYFILKRMNKQKLEENIFKYIKQSFKLKFSTSSSNFANFHKSKEIKKIISRNKTLLNQLK